MTDYAGYAGYYIISKEPLIIIGWGGHRLKMFFYDMFDILKNKKVYFFSIPAWSLESQDALNILKEDLKLIEHAFPKLKIIFLCNTKKEVRIVKSLGINCIYCNQNCFLDENIFRIIREVPKKYDAIYNAQCVPWKNHILARKIEKLALITYFENSTEEDYFNKIKAVLSNADWLNFKEGSYRRLTDQEVDVHVNESKVGLCLSNEEGAMFASTEYLLCGVPIVSVRTKGGGRDIFFDRNYVKIVPNDADKVENAVKKFIDKKINPEIIREKTITKMREHRERFVQGVQQIYDLEGVNRKFSEEMKSIFINKMFIWQKIENVKEVI